VFPIADDVYAKSWQQALSGFLAKEMDHIAVRETYKIVHAASHMDDSIMWPLLGEPFRDEASYDGTWFDGQDFRATGRTNTDFDTLEHIPGLAVGGWYDAGDYDIEATRQAGVIQDLAIAYREFSPQYDTMDVSWNEATGGMVELHRPDGVPDIMQQVKHGALNVLARLNAIGYNFKVVEVPTLRQYTHLGDGSAETDGYIYDPSLAEDEIVGLRSGKQDDRLAMVGPKDPSLQFNAAYALAAAYTVVKDYRGQGALSQEFINAAKDIWDSEPLVVSMDGIDPTDFMAQWQAQGQMAAEWNAAIELLIATNGDQKYKTAITQLWPLMKSPAGWLMSFGGGGWKASLILDYMDDAFAADFTDAVAAYKVAYDQSVADNPFGVPSTVGMWGGSTDVVDMGEKMYFLHKAAPGVIDQDYALRAATYILGTHPDNDASWLSGVGTRSIEKGYGNTRADDTFVAGGIVPGYVPIMPDLPEAKANFGMMWFESEYVIDTSAKWVVLGNAINALLAEEPPPTGGPTPTTTVTTTATSTATTTATSTATTTATSTATVTATPSSPAPSSGPTTPAPSTLAGSASVTPTLPSAGVTPEAEATSASANAGADGSNTPLSKTGASVPPWLVVAGLVLILMGGVLVSATRRSRMGGRVD
jgi:hypothetical protein